MGLQSLIEQQPGGAAVAWGIWNDGMTLSLKRQIAIASPGTQIDVFGEGWGLTLGHPLEKPIVSAIVQARPVSLVGEKIACFFPPGSIVEWSLQPGSYHFEGLFSKAVLPKDMPTTPVAFRVECETLPQDLDAVFQLIRKANDPIVIMKEDVVSAAARRMKRMIEVTYLESNSISSLTDRIGFNHATVIRAFSKAYGMTPVRYRSKLRVYSSLKDIIQGLPVKEAAKKSGYRDLSQFHRQFKKEMSHAPSETTQGANF